MVYEAFHNHMTSACGGLSRLGVRSLGLGGASGGVSKVAASIPRYPQGFESELSQPAHM